MSKPQLPGKSRLFLSYFRTLIDHQCTIDIELKINVTVTGKLKFVDNNMCMLVELDELELKKLPPQFASMKNGVYIRGSAIRAIYMPKDQTQIEMLSDLCQKQ